MTLPEYSYGLSPGDMVPLRFRNKSAKHTCQCCGKEYETSGMGTGRTRYCIDCRGLKPEKRKRLMEGRQSGPE